MGEILPVNSLKKKGAQGKPFGRGAACRLARLSPEQLYIPNKLVSTFHKIRTYSSITRSSMFFSDGEKKLADHPIESAYVALNLVDAIPVEVPALLGKCKAFPKLLKRIERPIKTPSCPCYCPS